MACSCGRCSTKEDRRDLQEGFLPRQDPERRIGLLVAGNSGLPGGMVCKSTTLLPEHVHAGFRTQEEDAMANWLCAECGVNPLLAPPTPDQLQQMEGLTKVIRGEWGMIQDGSIRTVQGIDYTRATPDHYGDCWIVWGARCCEKTAEPLQTFVPAHSFDADLVFVGASNANANCRRGRNACVIFN